MRIVIAIHEASGQDTTVQYDLVYSLNTNGGKPGQGYPCILIVEDDADEFKWNGYSWNS